MKTYAGSLQRRGRRWYLVVHWNGHQRWFALKTDKLPLARMRAARIAPADPNEERAWLEQVVREGERAREQLNRLQTRDEITWENLADRVLATIDVSASADSRACHAHWLSLAEALVREICPSVCPGLLTAEQARRVVVALCAQYRAAGRIVSFLRRVWADLGLDKEIWPGRQKLPAIAVDGEHYRRLTVEEIKSVHAYLESSVDAAHVDAAHVDAAHVDAAYVDAAHVDAAHVDAAHVDAASRRVKEDQSVLIVTRQDAASTVEERGETPRQLADMVLIGYSTGLRLSDVAELELSELALPFLRIVPNKTRNHKPNPLRIPLTDEALAVVMRLKLAAERDGTPFLFDAASRHRPSRRIAAAFRTCGVTKQGCGRASFHSLRATFISLMDEAGVPPHVTDAITGHGGGGMHARYTQPSDEALRNAVIRAIPPIRCGER